MAIVPSFVPYELLEMEIYAFRGDTGRCFASTLHEFKYKLMIYSFPCGTTPADQIASTVNAKRKG
jgi:hypothetical protein